MTDHKRTRPDEEAGFELSRFARLQRWILPAVAVIMFAIALAALHHLLRAYRFHDIVAATRTIPGAQIKLALLLTLCSYLALTGYDAVALRYVGQHVHYRRIALASFISFAVSMNLGFTPLTGSAIRYRLYSNWGLSGVDIAKLAAFSGLAFWLGFFGLAGGAFLLQPTAIPGLTRWPFHNTRILGIVFLLLVLAYLAWTARRGAPIRIFSWRIIKPPLNVTALAILVAACDWALAAGVLHALLPRDAGLSYFAVLHVFLLAQVVSVLSHVPGGLGVFESATVLLLHGAVPSSVLLSALLVFRVTYYLLPFIVAVGLLGANELLRRRVVAERFSGLFQDWVVPVIPQMFAVTSLISGAILLFSGSTPAVHSRLAALRMVLPLPIVELSHWVGSIAGVMMLLLARALQRRINVAYPWTVALLGVGIVTSLCKGLDYEEAIALGIMLAAFLPTRRHFYRSSSILDERLGGSWIGLIALVLTCSAWLAFFSFKHVEYRSDLWWQFAYSGDASRLLRATVGVSVALGAFAILRLVRPARVPVEHPTEDDLAAVARILDHEPRTFGHFALLGDKTLLFNAERTAYIMYGVHGRSWIALGGPVGAEADHRELVWQFREWVDRCGGVTVFHNVAAEQLPLFVDIGLTPLKFGETARVRLSDFALEGAAHKHLRQVVSRMNRDGCTFSVVPPNEVPDLLPDLRQVSDAWLAQKRTREKRFSVGFFDEAYLRRYPIGLVRQHGRILAFANVWRGAAGGELSIDLMRHVDDAPNGVMDYLFARLMLWGKIQGYAWFDLGMAPLAGFERHPLAPLWNRIGNFVFNHGAYFYNFAGLRRYKDKYTPQWEPRYLVCPGGLIVPRVLLDCAALTSGGLRGVVGH